MQRNWRTVAELIGMGAVVASLLLVVFELRQTQVAISASAHSDRTLRNFEINQYAAQHGTREMRAKQNRGESLSPNEQLILDNMVHLRMRHFEGLHYQYRIGTISDETWEANLEGLTWSMTDPTFKRNWEGIRRFYRTSFVALVEQVRGTQE
jgi:hypothetical protein